MAAPDEPTRRVEVPIVDGISDDSRCRSVSEEERRRRCAAFAALAETICLGTTTTRRKSHGNARDGEARGQVVVAAAAVETPAAAAREPRVGTPTPPVRDTAPRAAEDSAPDDADDDNADDPDPAFTKSEVANIVALLSFLDASQQSEAHDVMRSEHARASGADEPPEDLMKLSKNALARVDEYVRELLILPSRAESRDLTDVVAEMQTDRAKANANAKAKAKVNAKAKAKAKANPAKANPAKANPAKDQAVNPYELQRDQNIARNKERMAALNIRSLAGAVQRRQPSGGGKGERSPPVEASAGGVVEKGHDRPKGSKKPDAEPTYGCSRCRFSENGCYDSMDWSGKNGGKGCRPDAWMGSPKHHAETSASGDGDARGTPTGASAGASNPRPRRNVAPPERLSPTFGGGQSYAKEEPEDEEDEGDAKCLICGSSDCPEGDDFILCDVCNKGGHVRACLELSEVPKGSWYCSLNCLLDKSERKPTASRSVDIPSLKYLSTDAQSVTVPGLKYIRWWRARGRYSAEIKFRGCYKSLGGFDTVPEAVAAYNEEAEKHDIATQRVPPELDEAAEARAAAEKAAAERAAAGRKAAEERAVAERAAAEKAAAEKAAAERAAAERAAAEKATAEKAAAERAAAEKAAAEAVEYISAHPDNLDEVDEILAQYPAEKEVAERAGGATPVSAPPAKSPAAKSADWKNVATSIYGALETTAAAEKAAAENSPEPEPEPKLPAGYVAVETSSLHHRVRTGPMSCPFCDLACKGVKGIKRHLRFCQAANAAGLDKTAVPKGFVVAKVATDGSTNLKRKANEAGAEPEAGARVPARRVAPRRAPALPILAKPELATEGGEGEERGLGLGSGLEAGDAGELRLLRDKLAAQERRSAELMKINLDLLALTQRVMAMSAEGDGGATR